MLAFGLSAVAAIALASCGGEDAQLLPGGTAREITANLDTVQQLADEGDCVGAESAVQQVTEQIEALEQVDPKLKRALQEGAARLNEVIASCEEASTEAIAPAIVPTEPESDEEKPAKEKKEKEEKPKEKGPDAESPANPPPLPPGSEGEGKGLDEGDEGDDEEEAGNEESSSGGVGPGTPAEGDD